MRKLLSLILILVCTILFGQLPRTSNLIGSYSFSGNANDSSGNNYNGTFTGDPSLTTDRNGVSNSAYTFDGNDYIYTSNSMATEFTNVFTISAWIKSTNNATVDIFGLGQQECNSNAGPVIRLGSNINFNRCNEGFNTSNSNYYYDGVWHHYAFTYNGSQRKVYRDGNLVNTNTKSNIFNINTYGLAIGRAQMDQSGNYFIGSMDEVNVWNVALTDNEISSVYNYSGNAAPTNITLSATAFNENLPTGTHVASLTATDLDNGDSHTFTLASGNGNNDADNNHFAIQGASLKTSGTFDFETKSSYNIYINTNDGTANYAKAFTVTVNDVNDAPDDISMGPAIVENGLLIYVDASNPNSRGASQWSDLSGNGNHATVTGGSLGNNNYYTLDGNDHFKWSTDVLSAGSNFTMQVMFKTTNISWYGSMPLYNTFGPSDSGFWHHFQQNGTLGSTLGTMGTANSNDGVGIVQNEWQLTTLTYDGSSLKLYKNGVLRFTKSGSISWNLGNQGATAGKLNYRSSGAQYFFHGLMSSQLIYNRALTQEEITENYNYLNGTIVGSSISTLTLDEGSSVGSLVGTLSATGKDAGETLTYSLVSNGQSSSQHNSSFTVSGTQILTAAAIDYETTSTLNVNIQVSDGTSTYQEAFTVHVNDVNDNAPTDLAVSTSTFAESVTSGTAVASITTTDADSSAVNSFTYSLISGNGTNDADNSSFTISGPSLVTSGTFNYETKSSLKVYLQVNDGVASYAKALTLTVSDVNETPTDISLTSTRVVENVPVGTQVGTLSTTDPDSGNTFAYSLVSSNDARDDDNGSFTVSGTSLVTSGTIDYETKSSMNIYVNVNDGVNDYPKAFTISVSDTLEPITDVGFVEPSIVTNGLVLHLDAGNSNSYSGSGNTWNDISGNSNHFDINNVATHNNDGYFLFNSTLVGGTGMIGPPSNSFGLSQTNHTIELVMMPTAARGSIINFRGDSHDYAINVHVPWSNNNIYYDVGGCCGPAGRISGARNIVGQKIHIIFRSKPSTNPKREVILNGTSILNSGGNNTSTNNFKNTPVTLGGFMYNNNSSDHAVSARLYSVKVYNRALTDAEVASNFTSSTTITGGTSTSTVSVDEEVDVGTVVGSLIATDADSSTHTFTLVSGNGDAHNGLFSISGTNLLVNGFIDYEQTPSLSIRLEATDGQSTYSKALTVEVNDINEPPVIVSTELATDNSVVSVTFSEAVFNSNGGSGALQANDFSLTLTGGTASLSGSTPSSISNQGNTYGLGIPVTGNINGSEVLKVLPAATNSIYDAGAATASTTQASNTINLNGDADGDGVNDPADLCPGTPQGAQVDADGCAESQKDPDNDGITGLNDNCPTTANPGQEDTDGDGIGDACDPDIDADGIANESDNCPSIYNPNQVDTDADSIGNLCDTDIDGDGYLNWNDAFPFDPTEWLDTDKDGIGNNVDLDDDGDGFSDQLELDCDSDPLDVSNTPLDTDKDGEPDCIDTDDDGDGYLDEDEIACDSDPLDTKSRPKDFDRDKLPDCTDPDDDNDGCPDTEDAFPLDPRECKDTDGDGIGDNADWDSDNDGVPDSKDAFPFDPTEWKDTDGDGIGDNKDTDKNNDGFPDDKVFVSGVLTPGSTGLESTWKVINIGEDNFTIVTVYSPDGAVVFKKINYKNDWRGTHYKTGRQLPTGPYLYEVIHVKGQEPITGWLYIFN